MYSEIADAIKKAMKKSLDQVHTALPCKVVDVNIKNSSVTILPYGMVTLADGTRLPFPKITDVPVVFPESTSLGVGIVFPIVKGDEGICIVSEVELDAWRGEKTSQAAMHFDLTSAMYVPGLAKKQPNLQLANTTKGVVVNAGNTSLVVNQEGVTINGNLNINGFLNYRERG